MDLKGALCANYPGNLWLSSDPADQEKAKGICKGCPVQLPCAVWTDEAKPSCGVWAGRIIGKFVETEDTPERVLVKVLSVNFPS